MGEDAIGDVGLGDIGELSSVGPFALSSDAPHLPLFTSGDHFKKSQVIHKQS